MPTARPSSARWILCLVFTSLVSCSHDDGSSPLPRAPGSVDEKESKRAAENAAVEETERRADEEAKRESAVLAKATLRRALDTGSATVTSLDAFSKELERWQTDVEPLLTNEQGRVLAGDDRLIESFLEVYSVPRPTRADGDSVRKHVETILELPREAEKNGDPYSPSSTLQGEIDNDRKWADDATRAYKDGREKILALVAGAKMSTSTANASSLRAAIDNLAARKALASADAEKARRERIAADEVAARAAIDEQNASTMRQRLSQDAAVQRRTEELAAEQARLKKLADDPNIRAKFAPILSKGLYVPCLSPRRTYNYPVAMSYSGMQPCGGTTDVKAFVQLGLGGWNDRPAWKPPRTEEEWKHYVELLELFNQLAPIWIEEGVLQK